MAGDWIKIEKATPGKSEVMRLARLLGVTLDDALGKCVRFWIWAQDNTVDGFVTHTELQSVDEVMHCPGWAGAISEVGWLKYNDKTLTLTIPNWVRHNGESTKKRALSNERQRRWRSNAKRDANVDGKALPEKRREELYIGTVVENANGARTNPPKPKKSKPVDIDQKLKDLRAATRARPDDPTIKPLPAEATILDETPTPQQLAMREAERQRQSMAARAAAKAHPGKPLEPHSNRPSVAAVARTVLTVPQPKAAATQGAARLAMMLSAEKGKR